MRRLRLSSLDPDPRAVAPLRGIDDRAGVEGRSIFVPVVDEWDAPTVPGTVAARLVPCEGPADVLSADGLVMRGLVAEVCP